MSTSSEDLARRLGLHHHRRDPLAAAVQLETAMDSMRAAASAPAAGDGDGDADNDEATADRQAAGEAAAAAAAQGATHADRYCCQAGAESYPAPCRWHGDQVAADVIAAAVQHATHADQLTAAEFAALVDPLQPAVDKPAPEQEDFAPAGLELAPSAVDRPVSTPAVSPPAFSSERRLTWRARFDERSRDYSVKDHRLAGRAPLVDVLLPTGPVLDQGAEGACAGYAAVDAGNVADLRAWRAKGYAGAPADLLDAGDARTLYERAKQLDDVPGEDYEGTSILAAMKAGQEQGLWGGYLWAFGVRDIAQTLLQLQTAVVIGVPWGSRMFDTDAAGLVTIGSDGEWAGHALAVVGLSLRGPSGEAGPFFIWQNSWGPTYGKAGLGYIHHRDLAWLLSQGGEAAIPQGTL